MTTTTSHRQRRSDIQGLRAVAVLLVLAFHAGLPVPGGFLGVDVFFVVSGFVITSLLMAELERSGSLQVTRFYGRRVRRLLPAVALMTSLVVLVGVMASPAASARTGTLTGLFASLFSSNIYVARLPDGYFDPNSSLNPSLHTWTLGVEEQFYVVFPLVLLALWVIGSRARGRLTPRLIAIGGVVALAVGSLALQRWLTHGAGELWPDEGTTQRLAFYTAPARGWEFLAGCVIALATANARFARLHPALRRSVGWIALGIVVGAGLTLHEGTLFRPIIVLPVIATAALIASGVGSQVGASRLLAHPSLVWVGDLSFSLYLWHWPLIVFAVALLPSSSWVPPAAAALAFIPAWLSLRFVENPIRYGGALSGRKMIVLTTVCIGVPLLACAAALVADNAISSGRLMTSWRASQQEHADRDRGCDNATPLSDRDRGSCTWSTGGAHGTVVLFGDSNAGHFSEAVIEAGRRTSRDVEIVTYAGCPFVPLRLERRGREDPSCPVFADGTFRALVREKPSLVIVASRTDGYLDDPSIGLAAGPKERFTSVASEKSRLWQTALRQSIRRLTRAGIPVLLVHPVPIIPRAPDGCAVIRILVDRCFGTTDRASAAAWLADSLRTERRAMIGLPGITALDLFDTFCDRTTCSSRRGNVVRYSDRGHLSVEGSRGLAGIFTRTIRERGRDERRDARAGAG